MVTKNNEAANLILKREPRAAEQVFSTKSNERSLLSYLLVGQQRSKFSACCRSKWRYRKCYFPSHCAC